MKSIRWASSLILGFIFLLSLGAAERSHAQGYDLKFSIDEKLKAGDTVLLAYYFDDGRYIRDSSFVGVDGSIRFQGDSLLAQGMYLVIFPNRLYFDLLIGEEQQFTVEAKSFDISEKGTKVVGSPFTEDFLELQRTLTEVQKEYAEVRRLDSLARAKSPKDFVKTKYYKQARAQQEKVGAEVDHFIEQLQAKHRNDLLGKFVQSTQEVHVPEPPAEVLAAKNKDSAVWMWSYYYYAQHYMDNVDLSFEPLLRTPTFTPRLNTYLDRRILQIPDTINKYCDILLARAEKNEGVFRYLLSHLFTKYQTSDIMGMDAVFVHLAENYFLKGKTPWISAASIEKIQERVNNLKPNLIGSPAPNFVVTNLMQKPFALEQLKGRGSATIIVFWEPSCNHCKAAMPVIDSTFQAFKNRGVQIIGFMTQGDGPAWQKYVEEHKLYGWHHVWDPYRKSHFDKLYDIYSTPVIYLLDKDLTIVAKRIGAEQIAPILEEVLAQQRKD